MSGCRDLGIRGDRRGAFGSDETQWHQFTNHWCVQVGRNRIEVTLADVDAAHFEWLGPMDNPFLVGNVRVGYFELQTNTAAERETAAVQLGPPTRLCPILQSHVDTLMEAALSHGTDFAAEWLQSLHNWTSGFWLNDREHARRPWVCNPMAMKIDSLLKKHLPPDVFRSRAYECDYGHDLPRTTPVLNPTGKIRAVRRVVRNFLIGFGAGSAMSCYADGVGDSVSCW